MQAWFGDVIDRLVALEPEAGLILIVLLLLVVGLGYLGNWLVQSVLRTDFSARFGITDIPRSIRFRLGNSLPEGEVALSYPRWRYPNRDETRDRRRSNNELIRNWSTFSLGGYRVSSRDPLEIYRLVRQARELGHPVAWTLEELNKGLELERREQSLAENSSAAEIAARYADNPTGFERYCAELLRRHGYRVRVTPGTRDGGYDLELERHGMRYIAECKCYTTTTVGRPHLQKLVGANLTARAQGMIFVTTSDYSKDARVYARNAGIRLIDGRELSRRARQVSGSVAATQPVLGVALTDRDIWQRYPADVRPAMAWSSTRYARRPGERVRLRHRAPGQGSDSTPPLV